MISLLKAVEERHSVRQYLQKPIPRELISILKNKIEEVNRLGGLHIQLVLNEPKAFQGALSYGKFLGVENYFAMVGPKTPELDERIGYYGEELVLFSQQIGLNTCWAGLTYKKIKDAYIVNKGEKLLGCIALGYGENQGKQHIIKNNSKIENTPEWFKSGVRAAQLAPTAVNQQKFSFEYLGDGKVKANKGFSIFGYTQIDLGIAKLHFEIGAGRENFEWI